MAILSADKTYVTVEKGDNLWRIAEDYMGGGSKYQQLAAANGIPNPSLIYPGQIVYLRLTAGSSSSSSSSAKSSSSSNAPTITAFGPMSTDENTLFATWTWIKETETASYKVLWTYDTGDGVWLSGSSTASTINVDKDARELSRWSTYSIPANAKRVRFKVKPIAENNKDSKGNETPKWEAGWSSYDGKVKTTWTDSTPVETPPVPTVDIDNYKLTAELDNLDIDATYIVFEVYKNDSNSAFKKSAKVAISKTTKSASYSCSVDAGAEYKVRCKAYKGSSESDWSAFSSGTKTAPSAPKALKVCRASSETSVYLEWAAVSTATKYDIEYTTKKQYFDGSDQTTTISNIEYTHYEKTGLESGQEYFFRIRAANDKGESAWSAISSVIIGEEPAAPTTWSSTTTAVTGESVTLYWVHNAQDNSSQTYAELEVTIDGVTETHTIKNTTDEDEKDKTSYYIIDTSSFIEGTQITWRVRTAGITLAYGEWSILRTIDIYAPPTLDLRVTDSEGNPLEILTCFPFNVYALAGPSTQAPTGYHLSIKANETYETTDNVGNLKTVSNGEEVYSNYFDINEALSVDFSAGMIDLENSISYTLTCIVSMNSGLTCESTMEFTVAWTDMMYSPNAEITVDSETFTATIKPYCEEFETHYYTVTNDGASYVLSTEELDIDSIVSVYTTTDEEVLLGITEAGLEMYYCQVWAEGELEPTRHRVTKSDSVYVRGSAIAAGVKMGKVQTATGDRVLLGVTTDGTEVYYSAVDVGTLIEDVTLSVYRREYDGGFTELMTGLSNTKQTVITDPHPALDYARYRIVAITESTGAVSYYDLPGHPVNGQAVIIQWDEAWSNFNVTSEDPPEEPPWSGSMLKLPYNIDVSDKFDMDVSLVEYVGRKHPVSYYGTQRGESSSWKVSIEKDDKETLYALRRLAIWAGDVYVREPSGTGYWARLNVSFSQTHCELTIPVMIDLVRVEGGV